MKNNDEMQRIASSWAEKISQGSARSVDAILTQAADLNQALMELNPYGKKARKKLQTLAHLSQSTMAKLESIGKRVAIFQQVKQNLPPSMSTLYLLAKMPADKMTKFVANDLRAISRAKLMDQISAKQTDRSELRLLSVHSQGEIDVETHRSIVRDLTKAVEQVSSNTGVTLSVVISRTGNADLAFPPANSLKIAA